MKKKIGLYFGSFNPVHLGHLIIGQYFVANGMDEVWYVVSPQNPFKDPTGLAPEVDRLNMVKLAISDNEKLQVCDIEFSLPRPSYTADTLRVLLENFPEYQFSVLIGSDNLPGFHNWKEHEFILKNFPIRVFPRRGHDHDDLVTLWKDHDIGLVNAPLIEIASTQIRNMLHDGGNVQYLIPIPVWKYINDNRLYT